MQVTKIQNNNTNFKAGLTRQIKSEIMSCDANKIAQEFIKMGIPADFKGNKVIGWCSLKSFEIIKFLNKQYNLNLGLPRGIVVEDFNVLKNVKTEADAFCTTTPCNIVDEKLLIPENVIFINEYPEYNYQNGNFYWNKIDEISDLNFENKQAPTDSFMHIFLHEFSHAIHNINLLRNIGIMEYFNLIIKVLDTDFQANFQKNYNELFSTLCPHATTTPYEAVACDLGKRLTENLNPKTLMPTKNNLENSPYLENSIFTEKDKYEKTLRNFFNGKFD